MPPSGPLFLNVHIEFIFPSLQTAPRPTTLWRYTRPRRQILKTKAQSNATQQTTHQLKSRFRLAGALEMRASLGCVWWTLCLLARELLWFMCFWKSNGLLICLDWILCTCELAGLFFITFVLEPGVVENFYLAWRTLSTMFEYLDNHNTVCLDVTAFDIYLCSFDVHNKHLEHLE